MTFPKNISIKDYTYHLPVEKIACHPAEQRDASKLLIYKNGLIKEDIYKNIHQHLPEDSLLIFNNTKVINARVCFQKPTGGIIEIFCLEPYESVNEYSYVMNKTKSVRWKCMIGGASKWKGGELIKELGIGNEELVMRGKKLSLRAKLVEKLPDAYVVEFCWEPADLSFATVLAQAGDVPLPPYIKRRAELNDKERYQTIYAQDEGSVAAPTAGLHFTEEIFNHLYEKNIQTHFITLHVGAGTFKPVKAAVMQEHEMHAEWVDVSVELLEMLLKNISHTIVAIGTTSLRTLESLYWLGVKASLNPSLTSLQLNQWEVYEQPLANANISVAEALHALLFWLKKNNLDRLFTQTQLLIAPGYSFKMIKAIVTNFHQPQSTLLLLVAAAVGDNWRKIYDYALQNDFRFLSYGDGSLLFIG